MDRRMRAICVFAGVLILSVGVGIGSLFGNGCRISFPDVFGGEGRPETRGEESDPFVGEFRVVRVIDGDTVEIEGGERVRYIGIDAPESVTPGEPVGCFGEEASRANRELAEGKTVRLEKDVTDRDRYGRLLRYVYAGDTFVNLELVRGGFAYAKDYPPDSAKRDVLGSAEREARAAGAGLWNVCPER